MKTNKPFYKRAGFYLAAIGLIFTIIAIALYAGNCKSEFNGGNVSPAVVAWDIVAILSFAIAIAGEAAESFVSKDTILGKICSYLRMFKYVAVISLLVAFFMQILDEYSLLGTILYPIVSGTVGDPVAPSLVASYFTSLVFTLVSMVVAIVSALLHKKAAYTVIAEEAENNEAI